MGLDEHERNAKNRTSSNSASELTNPLEMVKKTCQALESLNSVVQARSYAQITILGLDEHETDTKNQTSRNSASELRNPLEMVKKYARLRNRSTLVSELGVKQTLRFWA